MKFLLELEERLESLIVGSGPFEQTLENPEDRGKAAERCRNRDEN